jgi:ubiquinone/menaquinone biosynthesis C-methylase UbiE
MRSGTLSIPSPELPMPYFKSLILVLALPWFAPADEDLDRRFHSAYEAKDYQVALETAEKMYEDLFPRFVDTVYNIACMHSRLGDEKKAFDWLERAVDAGFWDPKKMMEDEDLKPLRGTRRFRALVRKSWARGYITMLEREERDEFQKPDQVMAALKWKPGERVADVGAGSGYFTIPVAKAVGPEGKVWAIDVVQNMLDFIESRLEAEEIENVELKLVPRDDPQLTEGGVDTILMVDTLHYVKDRVAYAAKLKAGLAPSGRLVIIDYIPKSMEERPWGPTPEQQISRETVDREMAQVGLKPIESFDFLPEQYFVVYAAE